MESAAQALVPGTCDMVLILQTAHDTEDPKDLASKIAESLTPNGTLAVVQRSLYCKVIDNKRVAQLVEYLYADCVHIIESADGIMYIYGEPEGDQFVRRLCQSQTGLDWLPLQEQDFIQDVTKRILINAPSGTRAAFGIPNLDLGGSRSVDVNPVHRRYHYDEESEHGAGWCQRVTARYFGQVVKRMMGHLEGLREWEGIILRLEAIDAAMNQLAPDEDGKHTVTVQLSAAVLLATKK